MNQDVIKSVEPFSLDILMRESVIMDAFLNAYGPEMAKAIGKTINKFCESKKAELDRPTRAAIARVLLHVAVMGVEGVGIDTHRFMRDMLEEMLATRSAKSQEVE